MPKLLTLAELIGCKRGAQRCKWGAPRNFARLINVSDAAISRYLKGQPPEREVLDRIAEKTGTLPVHSGKCVLYMRQRKACKR